MTPEEHFDAVVVPAFDDYLAAERALSDAIASNDTVAISAARAAVLRRGRGATIELHQFADKAVSENASWLPSSGMKAKNARTWVQSKHCFFLRNSHAPVKDIDLLHDIADAFKHFSLIEGREREPLVTSDGAAVVVSQGWGKMRWGEGKWGGIEQLIVRMTNADERAMSSILQNCLDAWRSAMGRSLPEL